MGAVNTGLADIGCGDKPIVRVLNKMDLLDKETAQEIRYRANEANLNGGGAFSSNTVTVSALNGEGMQDFVAAAEEAMAQLLVHIEVEIPYSKGDELNSVHEQGNVEVIDYREKGTYVSALVPRQIANRLAPYSIQQQEDSFSSKPVEEEDKEDNDGIDWVALGRGRHSEVNKQQ